MSNNTRRTALGSVFTMVTSYAEALVGPLQAVLPSEQAMRLAPVAVAGSVESIRLSDRRPHLARD